MTGKACRADEESARYSSTNAYRDVHQRTVSITFENLSGQPAGNQPNDDPRKKVHTFLLLLNPGLTFRLRYGSLLLRLGALQDDLGVVPTRPLPTKAPAGFRPLPQRRACGTSS